MNAMITQIKERGGKVGVSIKPKTPVKKLYKYMDKLDLVLIMSVEPGFGGQKFMEPVLDKVRSLRSIIDGDKLNCLIEIDGGINIATAPLARDAGVDVMVAGSVIFGSNDPELSIAQLRRAIG
jgi:ribulose-phosphate 3-epimerase